MYNRSFAKRVACGAYIVSLCLRERKLLPCARGAHGLCKICVKKRAECGIIIKQLGKEG